jgi:hypothetical protein
MPTQENYFHEETNSLVVENEDRRSQIGSLLNGVVDHAAQDTLSVASLSGDDEHSQQIEQTCAVNSNRVSRRISEAMPRSTQSQVGHLLGGMVSRSERTLTHQASLISKGEESDNSTIDTSFRKEQLQKPSPSSKEIDLDYGRNPTITSTALAHSLWRCVLRPGVDTAIDATAGNGADSLALAQLLFIERQRDDAVGELISIDIQEEACKNTRRELECVLSPQIMKNNVKILQTSHSPLPLPRDLSSVALVVYNLGFLPNSPNSKKRCFRTNTETTIASLADAALLVRVGGMISVMTYPRTNQEEDFAVRAFLEGLALFSSVTHDWEAFVDELDCGDALRERLSVTLRHVLEEGGSTQTWRVHEHKKLGWVKAPTLLTATRIK